MWKLIKSIVTPKEYDCCRCCGGALRDKYGCGIVFIGNGFCSQCVKDILTHKH